MNSAPLYSSVDLSTIVYGPRTVAKSGGGSYAPIKAHPDAMGVPRFQLYAPGDQFPVLPFGISDKYDEKASESRRSLAIAVSSKALQEKLYQQDLRLLAAAHANQDNWFPNKKKSLSVDVLAETFLPSVSQKGHYQPQVRAKCETLGMYALKVWKKNPSFQRHLAEERGAGYRVPPLIQIPLKDENGMFALSKGDKVIPIVEFRSVTFTGLTFGAQWMVTDIVLVQKGGGAGGDFNLAGVDLPDPESPSIDGVASSGPPAPLPSPSETTAEGAMVEAPPPSGGKQEAPEPAAMDLA